MTQLRVDNVEVSCFAGVIPSYVTLKLYPDFYGMTIAFHISVAQYEWLCIHCNDKHLIPIITKGKYYLLADYAFDYKKTSFYEATKLMPSVKKNMMIWMRRAKVAILNREINSLNK